MNNKIVITIVAVIALLAGFWAAQLFNTDDATPGIGERTPATDTTPTAAIPTTMVDFELPDTEGKRRKLSSWKGKTIVLNFWATWCPPCREEIPLLVDTHDKYKSDGVVVIGVAIDTMADVKQFVDSYFINYPILVNEQENTRLMADYGNRIATLPYSVIIDRDGKIAARRAGAYHKSELEQVLAGILGKS